MVYLKGAKAQLEAYNTEVTTGENYQGTTSRWAGVQEIEGQFYIAKNDKYPSTLTEVDVLPQVENELV
tara:strand:+ start:428 stop:631 length:204 start_codon:yes stop_codon:yes gene_type:complete